MMFLLDGEDNSLSVLFSVPAQLLLNTPVGFRLENQMIHLVGEWDLSFHAMLLGYALH